VCVAHTYVLSVPVVLGRDVCMCVVRVVCVVGELGELVSDWEVVCGGK
jgi:hypothetical protein